MQNDPESAQHPASSDDRWLAWVQWNRLRPTQGAIGYVQALAKGASFHALPPESRRAFAQDHAIKVVRGPAGRLHVIDHHHWARAWFDMGMLEAPVNIAEDLSGLSEDQFQLRMSEHGWLHPFNAHGSRIPVAGLPESVGQLPDDVFQSLAAFIRVAGVFENPGEFNAKFAWADFFRQRISLRPSTVEGFAQMLAEAFTCCRLAEAKALPGFVRDRG
jgi:hypothetical protein